MSKRSPFWQPFSLHTPLGYPIAGYFNTDPGPAYGALRFTHVDGALPRPFTTPGLPALPLARSAAQALGALDGDLTDCRAVERADGTLIGFYPLFNADGELVEVAPRTADTVVVADTPWRPLAALVGRVHHAGIEEAVRRQRAVFVFSLRGAENVRLVRYPFALRLVLYAVLRGSGRTLASHGQVRGYANHYGLDLPATRLDLGPLPDREARTAALDDLLAAMAPARQAPPGAWEESGALLWASGKAGTTLLDLPLDADTPGTPGRSAIWEAMARLADRATAPSRERVVAALAQRYPDLDAGSLPAAIAPHWEEWARTYPEAFTSPARRIAV